MTGTAKHTVHVRAGEQCLSFSREFDAPCFLVFRAHVERDLFIRWLGPRGTSVEVDRFDATTGGGYRYRVVGEPGDAGYTFFGSYHEVTSPHRIVHTWEFALEPARPTLESLTFTELPAGRCRLDGLSLYTSTEHCTSTLAWDESGSGMDENFERLDELLAGIS